jgi:uncharacterized protein (DUF433 family)
LTDILTTTGRIGSAAAGSKPCATLPAIAPRRRTMDLHDLIVSNPDLLGGEPCFRGTRVPVATLFDNLDDGVGLEEILAEWPSLNRADVVAVLALAGQYVRRAAA